MVDTLVKPEDARLSGNPGECFFCHQPMAHDHKADCVIQRQRNFDAVEPWVWHPISTYPEGFHVLFWFPVGESGVPAAETAMAFREINGLSGWTHGGPNAGSDFDFPSQPTMWLKYEPAAAEQKGSKR